MNYISEVKGIKEDDTGTYLIVHIPDKQIGSKIKRYERSGAVDTLIYFNDSRRLSIDQMKKIYAILGDISLHTGHTIEELKIIFKVAMIRKFGINYFSLSPYNEIACSMEIAKLMINMLIDFCFAYDIGTRDTLLVETDDINTYLYLAMKYKKCVLCQKEGEIHHVDAIGMGRDRKKVDDIGHRKICLCREHHTEAHWMGVDSFFRKYHVYGIYFNEKDIKEWDELEDTDFTIFKE